MAVFIGQRWRRASRAANSAGSSVMGSWVGRVRVGLDWMGRMGRRDTYVPSEKSSSGAHHESWQRLVILPSIVKDLEWLEG